MATDAQRHIVELKAGGPDDPDGSHAATVLSAYFHAEHMRAFRQLLWRRLAALAAVWSVLVGVSSLLSRGAFVGGLALFAAVATGAAVVEWRASEKLRELLHVRNTESRSHFIALSAEIPDRPGGTADRTPATTEERF